MRYLINPTTFILTLSLWLLSIVILGCGQTSSPDDIQNFPVPPAISIVAYEEMGSHGMIGGIVEITDTKERFVFIRIYDGSVAMMPCESPN